MAYWVDQLGIEGAKHEARARAENLYSTQPHDAVRPNYPTDGSYPDTGADPPPADTSNGYTPMSDG